MAADEGLPHQPNLEIRHDRSQSSQYAECTWPDNSNIQSTQIPCGQDTPKSTFNKYYKDPKESHLSLPGLSDNCDITSNQQENAYLPEDSELMNFKEIPFPSTNLVRQESYNIEPNTTRTQIGQPRTKIHPTPLPPLNNTLTSMGKQSVLIVKVESENAMELLTDPLAVNELIFSEKFETINIKDVRINRRKLLIAVESETVLTQEQISFLTSIKCLGQFAVKCYIPNSDIFSYGVIYPISVKTNLENLKMKMKTSNDTEIHKIERLKKRVNGSWVDSDSIKVTFIDSKCPEAVMVHYVRYKVRTFINDPMQCYFCQKLGHTSYGCTAKIPKCLLCAGKHKKEDCKAVERLCANCKGNHAANSMKCTYIQMAKEIEETKVKQNLDYHTARQKVINRKQQNLNSADFPTLMPSRSNMSNSLPLSRTYSSVSQPHTVAVQSFQEIQGIPRLVDAGTQTEPEPQVQQLLDADFFTKLKNFIIEVVSQNIGRESTISKQLLADCALRNSFGIDLRNKDCTSLHQVIDRNNNNSNRSETTKKRNRIEDFHDGKTTTDEEEVLSQSDSQIQTSMQEEENIWETVEKKQIKVKKQNITEIQNNDQPETRRKKNSAKKKKNHN